MLLRAGRGPQKTHASKGIWKSFSHTFILLLAKLLSASEQIKEENKELNSNSKTNGLTACLL
jgi:hypothetical protein